MVFCCSIVPLIPLIYINRIRFFFLPKLVCSLSSSERKMIWTCGFRHNLDNLIETATFLVAFTNQLWFCSEIAISEGDWNIFRHMRRKILKKMKKSWFRSLKSWWMMSNLCARHDNRSLNMFSPQKMQLKISKISKTLKIQLNSCFF